MSKGLAAPLVTGSALAVDPGEVHCGMAHWYQRNANPTLPLWRCEWAKEVGQDECVDSIADVVREPADLWDYDVILLEGFWLKPGIDALRQAGSQLETVQVIGAIRHLCRRSGMPLVLVANGQDGIRRKLKSKGYKFSAHGHGDHAHDAEAIGYRGLELKVQNLEQLHGRTRALP